MDHIQGTDRDQLTFFPEALDDYIAQDNPVRFIDAFVDSLGLQGLGFTHAIPAETGRPPYHPGTLLKLYVYGYLNRIRSSRLLEREAGRNLELVWLLGKLTPDFKTVADFRKDNRKAIRQVCRAFILLCRTRASSAVSSSPSTEANSRPPTTAPATSPSASSNGNSRTSTRRSIPTSTTSTNGMKPSRTPPGSLPRSSGRRSKPSRLAGVSSSISPRSWKTPVRPRSPSPIRTAAPCPPAAARSPT
jgi:transposase